MTQTKRSTIKEVAKAAGVSIQTVSRVINQHPDVAEETRQRIMEIIVRLDYRPSALARSMIYQRTFTLGVVTAGLKYIGPSFTLNGIMSMAEQKGYAIFLEELPSFYGDQVARRLDSLLTRQVDGIIWAVPEIGDNRAWMEANSLSNSAPLVSLTMRPRENTTSVSYDNYLGGRLAGSHLLQVGYQCIGHISGPLDWWEASQRKLGWQSVLLAAGMPATDQHWVEGNWSSASGEAAFLRLLDQYPDLDAVFVANDQMAMGVLQVAARIGRRVPDDLGVVGFDNLTESAFLWPPLTTIQQDLHRLGQIAVEQVVGMVEHQRANQSSCEPSSFLLQPNLVVRESTQPGGIQKQQMVGELCK